MNGVNTTTARLLADGDILEFVRAFGQKGAMQDYWSEAELVEHLGADDLERMRRAGLELTLCPVLSSHELFKWEKWLRDDSVHPRDMIHVAVRIEQEWISVEGEKFPMKQNECAIMQDLL